MLTDAQREYVARVTATLQIIVAALAAGALMFAGVAWFVATNAARARAAPAQILLTYVAAGVALLALIVSWIVPAIIASSQRQAIAAGKSISAAATTRNQSGIEHLGDVGSLSAAYQTQQIIRAAILEGAAFFNLVAYIVEKQSLCLVAAGVMVLFMLSQFPTRQRVEDWLERELTATEQLRQMRTADAR
jgi:hypothetical protein